MCAVKRGIVKPTTASVKETERGEKEKAEASEIDAGLEWQFEEVTATEREDRSRP